MLGKKNYVLFNTKKVYAVFMLRDEYLTGFIFLMIAGVSFKFNL